MAPGSRTTTLESDKGCENTKQYMKDYPDVANELEEKIKNRLTKFNNEFKEETVEETLNMI